MIIVTPVRYVIPDIRESIIPANFGFAITKYQCMQIERKGAYV